MKYYRRNKLLFGRAFKARDGLVCVLTHEISRWVRGMTLSAGYILSQKKVDIERITFA